MTMASVDVPVPDEREMPNDGSPKDQWSLSASKAFPECGALRSGDSFIPFLVWGLFNLCRSLPKTYKPH